MFREALQAMQARMLPLQTKVDLTSGGDGIEQLPQPELDLLRHKLSTVLDRIDRHKSALKASLPEDVCIVCAKAGHKRDTVLLPCQHQVVCFPCSRQINMTCPECFCPVFSVYKV
eukprot:TRINITY_DN33713_c0_g1_i1.p2 TRINITY_DN33713_c0_g1~~TRINITY_DN33713_c0_g1_i1.p2  ORF type:complete len:115 (+),score=24.62 TRINITY_DN33713_c0_g1_i1:408-752(+)